MTLESHHENSRTRQVGSTLNAEGPGGGVSQTGNWEIFSIRALRPLKIYAFLKCFIYLFILQTPRLKENLFPGARQARS